LLKCLNAVGNICLPSKLELGLWNRYAIEFESLNFGREFLKLVYWSSH